LSVVVVTHRTRDQVRDCLDSLVNRGGLDGLGAAEVILIDNASGDGTAEMARTEFGGSVRLIANDENQGFSRGNNQGIEAAAGRNVLLLNPDTIVPPGELAKCVRWLDAQGPEVAAMSCRVQSVDGSLQHECARRLITPWSECCRALLLDRVFPSVDWFNRERFVGWDKNDARPVPAVLGAFMLIRRTAIERLGGLDERFFLMYEDMDWCKRAADAGLRIWYWPGAYITHLGGGFWKQEPIITYANTYVSALTYFRKHHPRAVPVVRTVSRVGMELKILLLRLNLLRKPGDAYTTRHLEMAVAARRTLRTEEPLRYGNWKKVADASAAADAAGTTTATPTTGAG
jgi:hypothetical protein